MCECKCGDQAPGRTITESDFCEAVDKTHEWTDEGFARTVLNRLGITIGPDPEPTNAEELEAALRTLDRGALGYSLSKLARDLDKAGVKAPTHD